MNKIGLHIGYFWGTGLEDDLFRLLDFIAQAKLDVIELTPKWLIDLGSDGRKKFKDTMDELGILPSLNGGLLKTNDISSSDPAIRRVGIDYCKQILELMPEIGCDRWSGVNYSEWCRRPEGPLSPAERRKICELCLESLREIIPVAEANGIDYCFEVVNRFEQFMFNTSLESVSFAEELGSPCAKVLLDVYHMNIEEDSIEDAILYAGSRRRLGHLHIGESNRRIPGTGKTHIDWDGIANAIAAAGYDGFLTMEPFVLTSAPNAHRICVWRDMRADTSIEALIDDARVGGAFLRTKLAAAGVE